MPNPTLAKLQQQLREKFPTARHGLSPTASDARRPDFDLRNPDPFPRGGITEIVPTHPAAGLSLVVASIMAHESAHTPVPELALIDGRDQFDPASFSAEDCSKLLWLRCQTPEQAIRAADLILRDGNLPRVVLDLFAFSSSELGKIPNSSWHRIKQSIELNNSSLIALTPRALIPCALIRLSLSSHFALDQLSSTRPELIEQLQTIPVLLRKCAQ